MNDLPDQAGARPAAPIAAPAALHTHGKLRAHVFLIHKAHADLDGAHHAVARLAQVRTLADLDAYVAEIVPRLNAERNARRARRKQRQGTSG